MKLLTCMTVVLLVVSGLVAAWNEQQQQKRILRRVIKSTPTATNLARVRLVTVRATDATEKGAVSEISSKEAASFGQRSSNETTSIQPTTAAITTKTKSASSGTTQSTPSKVPAISKTATPDPTSISSSTTIPTTSSSTTPSSSTSTSTTPTPSPTPTLSSSSAPETSPNLKASERQQIAPEVELMSSAQSSWQMMSAVEAPTAALISAGTRPATKSDASNELATSSSDFSRTHSSSRQQTGKARQQQASFYPPPPPSPQQRTQQLRQGKTSTYQATKTQWYLPTTSTTTTTTPRPAPIVQEPQYEQYIEQHVDSAPPGQAEPFAFDFNTQDTGGNGQYRKEESDSNGVVRGSYGFRDASGLYRHVDYIADHNGFRASIRSNEPGLEGGRDSQPASIRLDNGPAPARFTGSNNADWTASSSSGLERADLASVDPDFEPSHKAERIRVNFRD